MKAFTLTGNDTHRITHFIQEQKHNLDPKWAIFNVQHFSFEQLEDALIYAQTLPLYGQEKFLVIRGKITANHFELLNKLLSLNTPSTVVLITPIDTRTRIGKLIKRATTVKQFNCTPSWKINELATNVQQESRTLGVNLPLAVATYIASATGSNSARTTHELEKLATCRGEETLTFGEIKQLIPNLNHSILELANALKHKNALQVNQLSQQLLSVGEPPLKITATLLTLIRTWLKLKAALKAGIRSDKELTTATGISNPNRLYFLKQDIQGLSTSWLIKSAIALFNLEGEIKQGLPSDYFTTRLLTLLTY